MLSFFKTLQKKQGSLTKKDACEISKTFNMRKKKTTTKRATTRMLQKTRKITKKKLRSKLTTPQSKITNKT